MCPDEDVLTAELGSWRPWKSACIAIDEVRCDGWWSFKWLLSQRMGETALVRNPVCLW